MNESIHEMTHVAACFFCGVDSSALTLFLGLVIGSGVLSLVCFIAWGIFSGHFGDEERLARWALDAEQDIEEDVI